MAEESSDSLAEILRNKLKSVDVRTMEHTIAKAIGELVNAKLKCSIKSMDFQAGYSSTKAESKLSIYEPIDFNPGGREKEP